MPTRVAYASRCTWRVRIVALSPAAERPAHSLPSLLRNNMQTRPLAHPMTTSLANSIDASMASLQDSEKGNGSIHEFSQIPLGETSSRSALGQNQRYNPLSQKKQDIGPASKISRCPHQHQANQGRYAPDSSSKYTFICRKTAHLYSKIPYLFEQKQVFETGCAMIY